MSVLPISCLPSDKILIIAPHPDDECIGAGGVLALYPELCDVVVLSDGCHGSKTVLPIEEKEIRRKQFEEEMHYIKPNSYQWMGYEDGTLFEHEELLKDIVFSVYTKIFLPWYDDNHLDHTSAFMYAMNQIKKQENVKAEIYQYEVHVPFHDVTHILDITHVIDVKQKLIQFHQDQVQVIPYDVMVVALGKYRACQYGFPQSYMEAYVSVDASIDISSNNVLTRERELEKFQYFFRLMVLWLSARQKKKYISKYLLNCGYLNVSIYGYAEIGKLLYRELCFSGVNVIDVFDRRKIDSELDINVITPEDGDTSVDLVIVTAIYSFDEIKRDLSRMNYREIISLYDIVKALYDES